MNQDADTLYALGAAKFESGDYEAAITFLMRRFNYILSTFSLM